MFILGAGSAYPEGVLTDEHITALGLSVSASERAAASRFGVRCRRSALPESYLARARNADVLEARKVTTITPTALAVSAVKQAVERAGISLEQIGLIIADCATPHQTCPSEAQRIGGALGLKVPAYDITAGAGALTLSLALLASWKPERMSEYVLCVSVNTPTELLRFSEGGLSAQLLGDAASAVIVSAKHPGRLQVLRTRLERERGVRSPITVKRFVTIRHEDLMPQPILRDRLSAGLLNLGATKGAYFVGPQLFCGDLVSIAGALGVSPEKVVTEAVNHGYSLGSSAGCCISSLWDSVKNGDEIAVLHEGDGVSSGVLLKAVA